MAKKNNTTSKKTTAKKAVAKTTKKVTGKKTATKKTPAKTTKKVTGKKTATKKTPAKSTKKVTGKKTATKKTSAKSTKKVADKTAPEISSVSKVQGVKTATHETVVKQKNTTGNALVDLMPSSVVPIQQPKFKSGGVKITPKIKKMLPFDPGTYIFYPNDGLGFIEDLEKREVNKKIVFYYKISFPVQKMTARIPVKNVKSLRIRKVITKAKANKVLKTLASPVTVIELSWKDRLNVYQEVNKRGNALEMAGIVASLHLRKMQKALSFQERQYFDFAHEAVVGEIGIALNLSRSDAQQQVSIALTKMLELSMGSSKDDT